MTDEGDSIALAVLDEFSKLPAKRKPAVRDNGLHEWVPLSGIVAKGQNSVKCLALATGMKCLPASKIAEANGIAIHDWHAEILAIRAFNLFLLHECRRLARGGDSEYLLRQPSRDISQQPASLPGQPQPFIWNPEFTLHMYCSEAPCGDASMELIMSAQPDASPWDVPPSLSPTPPPTTNNTSFPTPTPTTTPSLPGRAFFSHLGIVRRKPSRADAPPSLSKSCSDKLALAQCTSLLSSLTSLFLPPIYLTSLVLPSSQFSPAACERCFAPSGRMAPLTGRTWEGGYGFVPFAVRTTGEEFGFSKRVVGGRAGRVGGSNLAVAWTAGEGGLEEGIIGGVLQGRKKVEVKGASGVSRRRMWEVAREVGGLLGEKGEGVRRVLERGTYGELKGVGALALRRRVKEEVWRDGLRGWVRNEGDEGFGI